MSPLVELLVRLFAPVLVEALLALIRGLESQGNRPDTALSFAVDVVAGLESSAVPPAERRDRAAEAVMLHLQQESGQPPSRSRANTLVELALQRVRNPPA